MKEQLEEILRLVELKKTADFTKCIEIAKSYYNEHFDFNIRNLLHMFPEDHKDKDGQPFWSGLENSFFPQFLSIVRKECGVDLRDSQFLCPLKRKSKNFNLSLF